MKLTILIAGMMAAIGLMTVTGAGTALAQTSVCQTNPSPVDSADPSIIVTTPAANASVTSPIRVSGQARVFEAVVSIKIVDANGASLAETTTLSAEGQALSAFSADVTVSVTTSTDACLWVYESSSQDGSPINVVQVPLTISAAGLPNTGGGASNASDIPWLAGAFAVAGAGLVGASLLGRRLSGAR